MVDVKKQTRGTRSQYDLLPGPTGALRHGANPVLRSIPVWSLLSLLALGFPRSFWDEVSIISEVGVPL